MSEERSSPSFGDPNAQQQPPTPQETPTTAVFPSPVFETPRNHHNAKSSIDEPGGWTPRFAEEYSVFNSTPGNLRGQAQFPDLPNTSPDQVSVSARKRPLSSESIAAQIASHVNYLSPDSSILPPVDPTRRLSSFRGDQSRGDGDTDGDDEQDGNGSEPATPRQPKVASKRLRRGTLREVPPQTATPPPSAHKGKQKLAPKLRTETMQDDQTFGPDFMLGNPAQLHDPQQQQQQQQHMDGFVTTPTDMFGYPISAPAAFADTRSFWDTDMGGMDLDFSATANDMFQAPTGHHRGMGSMDWGKANDMFQPPAAPVPSTTQNQENNHPPPAKKERAIAPKPPTPAESTSAAAADPSMFAASFPASMDDGSFNMMGAPGGGVDPGLLFSRPPSSSMESVNFDPMAQIPMMQSFHQPEQPGQLAPQQMPMQPELRRSASSKDMTSTGRKIDRASGSSPVKNLGAANNRPGLSRSFSENRGRKSVARSSTLPTLAPAIRQSTAQMPPGSSGNLRPVSQHQGIAPRPPSGGRISPLKNNSHHRLSSLTSIPESSTSAHGNGPGSNQLLVPRTRTSVKFTIDSRGRARAETTTVSMDDDDDAGSPMHNDYDDDNDDIISPTKLRANGGSGTMRRRRRGSGNAYKRNSWTGGSNSRPTTSSSSPERPYSYYDYGDDSSSTDDEPIIIPSRNTSFALPDPRKPTLASARATASFHEQQRRSMGLSSNSNKNAPPVVLNDDLGIFYSSSRGFDDFNDINDFDNHDNGRGRTTAQNDEAASEAETVMNVPMNDDNNQAGGDAASELRKVVEDRQKKAAAMAASASIPSAQKKKQQQQRLFSSGSAGFISGAGATISAARNPPTLQPGVTPDKRSGSGVGRIRCVCHVGERREGYMVQCESCDMWLHGRCINITRQTHPSVYVCAFCANTPNAHGARGREVRRTTGVPNPRGGGTGAGAGAGAAAAASAAMMPRSATSPLAHKSFKSFR